MLCLIQVLTTHTQQTFYLVLVIIRRVDISKIKVLSVVFLSMDQKCDAKII